MVAWIERVREWLDREDTYRPEVRNPEDVVGEKVSVNGTSFGIDGGKGGWKLEKLGPPEVSFQETGARHMQQITEEGVELDTLTKGGRILVLPRSSWSVQCR